MADFLDDPSGIDFANLSCEKFIGEPIMSIHLTNALNAVGASSTLDLPIMPWEPTSAMIDSAVLATGLDEATIRKVYAIMLEAYGNSSH